MLEDYNRYYLSGEVDRESTDVLIEAILERNLEEDKPHHIQLYINSDGGDMDPTMALVDAIEGSRIPIYTFGIGNVASSGLILLMSGEKGHRYITKNTNMMSHMCWFGEFEGTTREFRNQMKLYENCLSRQINHYMHHTGLTSDTIERELLNGLDKYLTPNEALYYNIADAIVNLN